MKMTRLDAYLIDKGFAHDRAGAFIIVTEGRVFVGGQKAISPAQLIHPQTKIEVRPAREFVGRGAYKLEGALQSFAVDAWGKICADIGAATGGFTEVLLKKGATKVYAIDTAKGKLALKIRENARVVVIEKTDVRKISHLPDEINLATIDVSLISLRDILPAARRFLKADGEVVALFKPQYETRDATILKNGVIIDSVVHEKLFADFLDWAKQAGWKILNTMQTPIQGSKGNVEYLVWLKPNNLKD